MKRNTNVGTKPKKVEKTVRYGFSYVDQGDSCDGYPRSWHRLYDTPEKAKRAMVADARFFAKANEINPDEIIESKFCEDFRCEIKDRCVWQTFKVEC